MRDSDRVREPIYLESGAKRVFACSIAWPGWARSAKTEAAALAALAAAAPRYGPIADLAGLGFDREMGQRITVVDRLLGDTTTDFGAPSKALPRDFETQSPEQIARDESLLRAIWTWFDRVLSLAPAELRKGPRGGGRDRDDIARHVLAAESVYARKIGIDTSRSDRVDPSAQSPIRTALLSRLQIRPADLKTPTAGRWPAPYALRRIAWHVVDHGWEIEDRSAPGAQGLGATPHSVASPLLASSESEV